MVGRDLIAYFGGSNKVAFFREDQLSEQWLKYGSIRLAGEYVRLSRCSRTGES